MSNPEAPLSNLDISSIIDLYGLRSFFHDQKDLVLAYIFGSVLGGSFRPFSDVDLAVLLDSTLAEEMMINRQISLSAQMATFCQRDIDLVLLNKASPLLAYEVLRHGKLLYARGPAELVEFEVCTRQIYFDIKPMLDFHDRVLLKRIKEVGLGRRKRRGSRTLEVARQIYRAVEGAGREHS